MPRGRLAPPSCETPPRDSLRRRRTTGVACPGHSSSRASMPSRPLQVEMRAGCSSSSIYLHQYCRFHLVCPGIKFGERNFFWAWYKLKLICVLYFHFVPNLDKVPLAKFFPERGGGTNQVESTIAAWGVNSGQRFSAKFFPGCKWAGHENADLGSE